MSSPLPVVPNPRQDLLYLPVLHLWRKTFLFVKHIFIGSFIWVLFLIHLPTVSKSSPKRSITCHKTLNAICVLSILKCTSPTLTSPQTLSKTSTRLSFSTLSSYKLFLLRKATLPRLGWPDGWPEPKATVEVEFIVERQYQTLPKPVPMIKFPLKMDKSFKSEWFLFTWYYCS
jgi:hypothetical protein